ncbi:mannose-6-phosphate receptor binding protein 1 isoform X2 [Syngnathoides biaculeatus]|uniref:mannose-6-phosphate receptor binding protein 1 isoform X2 n=1 Tax=Syngnathoides biaculeatus TaxID=300417 RepID=UPI002ADDC6CA|nr:mannose-6-phosphate receptor binding protein 1 isoform X2 [Syngnathoides biaculeatus]
MADGVKTIEAGAGATGDQQNVVSRVGNLPLGVMDAAESGVRTLGAAAATGTKPLLNIIEPQLATVNEYAMKGLDKMEQKLPILQQPAQKVVSDTVGIVCQSVTGAKDSVVGAVMGGVEKTRAAVSGGISTVMSTSVGQMVSSGVGLALTRSEDWVDQNLPLTERELAAVGEPATCQVSSTTPSYFVRLGNLSAKVQERALQQSLTRARRARDTTRAAVAQLSSTLDLLETARTGMASGSHQIGGAIEQLQQRWTEWSQKQPGGGQPVSDGQPDSDGSQDEAQRLEWRVLSMARGLSEQLRSASSNVVSSAQGLPGAVQDQLSRARRSADELQASLVDAGSLTPLLLEKSRQHLSQVQQSLDGVTEYLLNNTPLNWLVGPFAPMITERMGEDAETAQQKSNA